MSFDELPEFQKELERLSRKYKSLLNDVKEFSSVISAVPLGNSKHFNIITQVEDLYIIKARLFCKYLKGSSLRVIYAYFEQDQRVEFVELYYKGDKINEDRDRIRKYLKTFEK